MLGFACGLPLMRRGTSFTERNFAHSDVHVTRLRCLCLQDHGVVVARAVVAASHGMQTFRNQLCSAFVVGAEMSSALAFSRSSQALRQPEAKQSDVATMHRATRRQLFWQRSSFRSFAWYHCVGEERHTYRQAGQRYFRRCDLLALVGSQPLCGTVFRREC